MTKSHKIEVIFLPWCNFQHHQCHVPFFPNFTQKLAHPMKIGDR